MLDIYTISGFVVMLDDYSGICQQGLGVCASWLMPCRMIIWMLCSIIYVKNCVVGRLAQATTSNTHSTHKEKLTREHTKRDGGQNVFLLVSSSSSSHLQCTQSIDKIQHKRKVAEKVKQCICDYTS